MREAKLARFVRESGAFWIVAAGCYILPPGFSEYRPTIIKADEDQESDLELAEILGMEDGVVERVADGRILFDNDNGNDFDSDGGFCSSSSGSGADDEISESDILEAFTETLRVHGPGRLLGISVAQEKNTFFGMTLMESPFNSPLGSSSSATSPRQRVTQHLTSSDLETEELIASALD